MQKITPCLWSNFKAQEALDFYKTVFKDFKMLNSSTYPAGSPGPEGELMMATFSILGHEFMLLNGGPGFTHSEAVSFIIDCEDQKEVDYYWTKLTADGGEESMCGWLKDKFGISWQITPTVLIKRMSDKDPAKAERVMQAMLKMKKIIVADIEKAYDGK